MYFFFLFLYTYESRLSPPHRISNYLLTVSCDTLGGLRFKKNRERCSEPKSCTDTISIASLCNEKTQEESIYNYYINN